MNSRVEGYTLPFKTTLCISIIFCVRITGVPFAVGLHSRVNSSKVTNVKLKVHLMLLRY